MYTLLCIEQTVPPLPFPIKAIKNLELEAQHEWKGAECKEENIFSGSVPLADPDPNPTSFFSDFKDAKKLFFIFLFFLITYPQAQHVYRKRERSGSGAGSVPLSD